MEFARTMFGALLALTFLGCFIHFQLTEDESFFNKRKSNKQIAKFDQTEKKRRLKMNDFHKGFMTGTTIMFIASLILMIIFY